MRLDAEAEARILKAFRTGDRATRDAALEELFDTVSDDLRAICRHVTGDPTDGEDALQETLLAVYSGLPAFRGKARLTTWIWRIAIRTAIRQRSKSARQRTVPLRPGLAASAGRESAQTHDEAERLAAALATLSAEHRAVLVLSAVEGSSGEEIAAALGIPVGTVWSRIHNARRKLQKALATERLAGA